MPSTRTRLGDFEFNPATGELTRDGDVTTLRPQAARVLAALVDRPGELVSREELTRTLWPRGGAEADLGLNVYIRQVRAALGDDAEQPRYVETLRARGYRLIAAVEPSAAEPGRARFSRLWLPIAVGSGLLILLATALRIAGPEATPMRLAVMPLEGLGGNDSTEYLRRGLAEDVITLLAANDPSQLAVIARTSSFQLASDGLAPAAAAALLNADYVLQGTVRQVGDRYRVTARLLDVVTTTYVWSEQFDLRPRELVQIDREIAASVAEVLSGGGISLIPGRYHVAGTDTPDPSTDDAVLRARYLVAQFTRDAATQAVALLGQSLARDSTSGPVLVELANAHLVLGEVDEAEHAITRARRTGPSVPGVDYIAGRIAFYGNQDVPQANSLLAQSIRVEPGVSEARHVYAQSLAAAGRLEEAVRQGQIALDLDPISSVVRGDIGWVLFYAGQHSEARRRCRSTLELRPESSGARVCTLLAAHFQDDLLGEERIISEVVESLGGSTSDVAMITEELRRGRSESLWSWLLERGTESDRLGSVDRARLLALLGRPAQAVEALNEAALVGRRHMWVGVDPVFAPLASRPDFQRLLSNH